LLENVPSPVWFFSKIMVFMMRSERIFRKGKFLFYGKLKGKFYLGFTKKSDFFTGVI